MLFVFLVNNFSRYIIILLQFTFLFHAVAYDQNYDEYKYGTYDRNEQKMKVVVESIFFILGFIPLIYTF